MISVQLRCVNVHLIVLNSAIAYNSAHQALICLLCNSNTKRFYSKCNNWSRIITLFTYDMRKENISLGIRVRIIFKVLYNTIHNLIISSYIMSSFDFKNNTMEFFWNVQITDIITICIFARIKILLRQLHVSLEI